MNFLIRVQLGTGCVGRKRLVHNLLVIKCVLPVGYSTVTHNLVRFKLIPTSLIEFFLVLEFQFWFITINVLIFSQEDRVRG